MKARYASLTGALAGVCAASLALSALTASLLITPASAAGGLGDFFKKGDGSSQRSEETPSKSGGSVEPDRSPSASPRRGSTDDAAPSLWSKQRPQPSTAPSDGSKGDPSASSGVFGLFGKRGSPAPPTGSASNPDTLFRPSSRPARPATGSLFSTFDKPGRPQPYRPYRPTTAPPIVIHHFYDRWYYPYDRFFYTHYYPHVCGNFGTFYYGFYFEPAPRYNEGRYDETAAEALRDIERGWEERRWSYIARHVDADQPISV
ncbi:MAG: hypothetical protein QHJ73_14280, partial [Armatimonadota bacterium]|nr:hypothetical protein [Armatimonadota bacterium]